MKGCSRDCMRSRRKVHGSTRCSDCMGAGAGGAAGRQETPATAYCAWATSLPSVVLQVGTLHLVMSLEEVGPATAATEPLASAAASPRRLSPRKAQLQPPATLAATPRQALAPLLPTQLPQPAHQLQQQAAQAIALNGLPAAAQPLEQQPTTAAPTMTVPGLSIMNAPPTAPHSGPAASAAAGSTAGAAVSGASDVPADALNTQSVAQPSIGLSQPAGALPPHPATAYGGAEQPAASPAKGTAVEPSPAAAPEPPSALQALAPEIEAAWELEQWKRQEQQRWREELAQREAERMVGWALEAWVSDVCEHTPGYATRLAHTHSHKPCTRNISAYGCVPGWAGRAAALQAE